MSLSLSGVTSYSDGVVTTHTIPFPAGAGVNHPFIFVMNIGAGLREFRTDGVDSEDNLIGYGSAGAYAGIVRPAIGQTQFIVNEFGAPPVPSPMECRMIVLTDTIAGPNGFWESPFTSNPVSDTSTDRNTGVGDFTIDWTGNGGVATIGSPWGDTANWVWFFAASFLDVGAGNALPATPGGWTLQADFTWSLFGGDVRTGWYTRIERATSLTLPTMTSGVSDFSVACSFTAGFWPAGGGSGWGVIIS